MGTFLDPTKWLEHTAAHDDLSDKCRIEATSSSGRAWEDHFGPCLTFHGAPTELVGSRTKGGALVNRGFSKCSMGMA